MFLQFFISNVSYLSGFLELLGYDLNQAHELTSGSVLEVFLLSDHLFQPF